MTAALSHADAATLSGAVVAYMLGIGVLFAYVSAFFRSLKRKRQESRGGTRAASRH